MFLTDCGQLFHELVEYYTAERQISNAQILPIAFDARVELLIISTTTNCCCCRSAAVRSRARLTVVVVVVEVGELLKIQTKR